MLDPTRWPEAESLLDRALAEPPERRAAFLAREVRDPALAEELALVIAEADRADDFLAPGGAISGPLFAAFAAAGGDVDHNVGGVAEALRAQEPGALGHGAPESRALESGALEHGALREGQTLGPYRVDRRIGRGGMGEVFRARDLRLGRDVALKVLPSGVAVDATRRARVEREARTLAALSHPNIAAIHDLYEEPSLVALVLELIEGPTLAERLAGAGAGASAGTGAGAGAGTGGGPLPIDTTISIARQIVDAMAAAHERGIVHRDLKPSNIKVTPEGFVKILDFGLARVVRQRDDDDADDDGEGWTMAPSITTAVHGPGVVMGTAAYMSPEQASGRRVDHRADIWAFGCILFEMLTGRRAFEGDTAGQVLARVIEREPDFALLPASTPPSLARLVRRCLRKDPARRLGFIGDARLELDDQEIAAELALAASRAASLPFAPHPALSPTSGRGEKFEPPSQGSGGWREGGSLHAAAMQAEAASAASRAAASRVASHLASSPASGSGVWGEGGTLYAAGIQADAALTASRAAASAEAAFTGSRGALAPRPQKFKPLSLGRGVWGEGGPSRSAMAFVVVAGALIVSVAAAGALVMRWRAQPSVVSVARLAVPLPADHEIIIGQLPALARSRDGRMLVYRARHDGVMRLFARGLEDAQPRALAGTEGVEGHAVSPDGRNVAFARDGRLFRLAIAGGTPVPICDAPGGATLDWGADNAIIFSASTNRRLMRVDASGGTPMAVTTLDAARGDTAHGLPGLSPDGRTVAFTVAGRDGLRLAIAPSGGDGDGSGSAGGEVRILGDGRQPRFLRDDLLLFVRDRSVWAAKIDVRAGRFEGDAVQVLDGAAQAGLNGYVHFATADDGSLVYVGQLPASRAQRLVWLDRTGAEVAMEYEGRGVTRFAIAPDATRVAFSSSETAGRDVWVFDRARRTRGRLTLDPETDTAPVWSPDSRRIAYRSDRRGGGMFIRAADGADEERRLTRAEGLYHTPYTFTPDGRRLLFVEFRDYKQQDVLSVRVDGSGAGSGPGRVEPVLTGPAAELRPALSPDGRWLAYQSDESGRFEIYVRPFPDVNRAKVQVSVDGGTSPVWRADGRELFFASAGALIAVDVTGGSAAIRSGSARSASAGVEAAGGGATFTFGALRRLFEIGGADERLGPLFDVQPDGTRVLVLRDAAGGGPEPTVHLVQGWRSIVEQAIEQARGDARESRR